MWSDQPISQRNMTTERKKVGERQDTEAIEKPIGNFVLILFKM